MTDLGKEKSSWQVTKRKWLQWFPEHFSQAIEPVVENFLSPLQINLLFLYILLIGIKGYNFLIINNKNNITWKYPVS